MVQEYQLGKYATTPYLAASEMLAFFLLLVIEDIYHLDGSRNEAANAQLPGASCCAVTGYITL